MSEQEALDKRLLDLLHEKPELYDLAIKMLTKGIEHEYKKSCAG